MTHRKRKSDKLGPGLHERITARIVEELKQGTVTWVKPWLGNGLVGVPRNYVSNRAYSGINVLLIWLAALEHGFTDSRWLTANQIMELGGSFKGERATRIVFAKECARKAGTDEEERFFVHKGYNVFNVSQVSGITVVPEETPPAFEDRIEAVEAFIAAQDVPVVHGGDHAFYSRGRDAITLPFPGSFISPAAYYAVALHELAHASGHVSRLNREGGPKGSPAYAFEELVAELAAAFLCAELGVPECSHHAAYIESWIRLLENDPRTIFNASREAHAAVAFLRAQAARHEIPVAA